MSPTESRVLFIESSSPAPRLGIEFACALPKKKSFFWLKDRHKSIRFFHEHM